MQAHILGFCGTAKNTGKTTAMKVIMDAAAARKMTIALTSIGYDGELVDHVTGLPKPRVYALPGTLLAIADSCAKGSTADIEILQRTDIGTALGKVIIGRVRKPGLILLAGPTKSVEIRKVNQLLDDYGCDLILVDGALNRIAPMVETDGIIMATGASRNTDIAILTAETAAMSAVYQTPLWEAKPSRPTLMSGSVLDEEMAAEMLGRLTPEVMDICINGIIGEKGFEALLELGPEKLKGKSIILPDPIKLLVAGSPIDVKGWIDKLKDQEIDIYVKRQVDLRMITINPFYPQYRYASHDYEAAYIDKEALKQAMLAAVTIPVVNVLDVSEGQLLTMAIDHHE
jgi:molybdopterin-guanine dinucleotide biosynthesis protein